MRAYKLIAAILAAMPAVAFAAIPSGYYNNCEGLSGKNLLHSLETTISGHTAVGYNGLWNLYKESDTYPDGKIWDIYSTKHWTFDREQCGTYSAVGDCYNREHSFPKSWFDDAQPMYCDAFHIYPTDGKVNGQRSNYPYGECANGTTLPSNAGVQALGKLGRSTFPGYSGTVFEPDDEYKGDVARSYFYMAACYNSLIDDWDSDMLAHNTYPAFTSWAVNLLLKWHRQDPVSDKERKRNEAIYAKQHNRNPFIDHPELAEHIWGDKQSQSWTSYGTAEPSLAQPVDGSVYDLGYLAVGAEASVMIPVKGVNLTAPVTFDPSAADVTFGRAQIPAAEAIAGTSIEASWNPEHAGSLKCDITFTSGSAKSKVILIGTSVDGLVAYSARNITDTSCTASWLYVGDEDRNGNYTINIKPTAANAETTRKAAPAHAEACDIDGLEPETEYEYWITSATMESNHVTFTTGMAVAFIQLLYDGTLFPTAAPGEPSDAYEVLMDCENINTDIMVQVDTPFQLSSDKAQWSTKIAVSHIEDRFYLRIYSETEGLFSTTIKLTAGDYTNDNIEIEGLVTSGPTFIEDFEADADGCDTYNGCDYRGKFASWHFSNAGIWSSDKNYAHQGNQCLRMGKSADSQIEMTNDKDLGLGTVTLYARKWSDSEANATLCIDYSTDGGNSWKSTTAATVESTEHQEFSFLINEKGPGRIRVRQMAGQRFIIDDIAITNHIPEGGLEGVASDYRAWDAFCRDGVLVVEMSADSSARIYGANGIVYFDGVMPAGETTLALPKGLYIISVADFSRRVLVK